ncbi:MAG TPA: sialidase family protein, partial [Actinomycetota bacterium]|nr:sialidase family protein [Actinomycetota bacterium]
IFDFAQGVGTFDTCCSFKLMRSTDRGETWSDPIDVGPDRAVPAIDPDTGERIRNELGRADLAVDLSPSSAGYGSLYASWPEIVGSGNTKKRRFPTVAFTESTDGGLTWSPLVKVNQSPTGEQAINPSIDVASDGTVAITYYDFRNNTADPGLPTDYWLIHCHASQGCTDPSSWAENHVAGPFDIERAPLFRGYFIGDYEGLASTGTTFLPTFTQTTPTDMANTYMAVVAP